MGIKDKVLLAITHPFEFRTLVQFYMYHNNNRDIADPREHASSGWDRKTMRKCWEFLDLTSRSFSAVIKELDGDLARTICLFYLVLRGLDTIEDDMTIPDEIKQPLLRSFHEKTVTPGWTFNGNGPDEKDRQLLVEYDNVTEEMNHLSPASRDIIVEYCRKMETGMADYAHKAATTGSIYVEKTEEYDLYCHYVAGIVGEGLSRLFSASGKEQPWIGEQLELSNSMGLMLQKTNIIRDFREDVDQKRFFWPREIWGRKEYGGFTEMAQMHAPGREREALWVLSGMVVDALRHAPDSLDYLRLLKNQTVFNFCAIPQVMAMATLHLVFMNPEVFKRNIKIRKAEAAKLIMGASNPRDVAYLFRDYARMIHKKASPIDPNFIRISVACGKIEQWCEQQYPSFVQISQSGHTGDLSKAFDPFDARTRIQQLEATREKYMALEAKGINPAKLAEQEAASNKEVMMLVGTIFVIVVLACLGIVYVTVKIANRFEL